MELGDTRLAGFRDRFDPAAVNSGESSSTAAEYVSFGIHNIVASTDTGTFSVLTRCLAD